ncbi:hypothetical protein PHYSODRAFT_263394 [Phytophthora sojae]|uniref:Uncharacterized protein n=1 Tax=Phytophthora sojae (strain P6497) TaxID=1094619 RepID=G4YZ39_PHYSP|nr:hypothetical protein PHYSODRAFT_263394 [Phytophthora sojae]EGZ23320.1 hypothetical protein PHYSODRAFT_263394 [Phytophthora sojae]|eukprot:XP_009518608.1 hypothetical protein PHYSODRAFT_263394 [Phytophthora sojae]
MTWSPPLQLKIVALALPPLADEAQESIGAALVTDFLVLDMPLSKAVELSHAGFVALLDLVGMRGLRDAERRWWTVDKLLHSEKYYYMWEFSLALAPAVRCADLRMVQRILQHFSGCPVEKDVVEECGSFSYRKRTLRVGGCDDDASPTQQPATSYLQRAT